MYCTIWHSCKVLYHMTQLLLCDSQSTDKWCSWHSSNYHKQNDEGSTMPLVLSICSKMCQVNLCFVFQQSSITTGHVKLNKRYQFSQEPVCSTKGLTLNQHPTTSTTPHNIHNTPQHPQHPITSTHLLSNISYWLILKKMQQKLFLPLRSKVSLATVHWNLPIFTMTAQYAQSQIAYLNYIQDVHSIWQLSIVISHGYCGQMSGLQIIQQTRK